MKSRIQWYAIGIMSLNLAAIGHALAAGESPQKAVTAAEDQWTQAEKTNNSDAAAALLADKFMFIDSDGAVSSRAKYLADSKETKFTSIDVTDLHVTVTGHTAVATMIFKSKGTLPNGKPMDINARRADTWVKMPDGKWQCVLSQGSNLTK
jgi:ketosteroid isomerase-like protein